MRTKKIFMNSMASLGLQFVTVICGFILPRLMLRSFGSEVNGAVSSITQFLGYISFLEAGVGGVTRAALYKPLADGNMIKVNAIVNATQSFFRKIACVFLGYVFLLSCIFKYISHTKLDGIFVFSLVWILAISIFVQYYFGISYSILLKADQLEYISLIFQMCTIVMNTVISVILLKMGCGVHIVKLVSAGVYIIRPILLNRIAKRKYKIDKSVAADRDAIKQRWNGLGQNIAYYIHNNVDNMIITVMLGLKWSSVYSIYYMVITGVKRIVDSLAGGSEAAFGNMIAKDEKEVLNNRFQIVETLSSMTIVVFFSTTGLLLIDFIRIYTSSVNDINYLVLPVGILFVISEALHCIKQSYHNLIMAAGHYKETQKGAFIEAGMNFVLSVILAKFMELSGILLATIIATLYRTFDYIFYLNRNILYRKTRVFLKRQMVNMINTICILVVCLAIPFSVPISYSEWALNAIFVFIIATVITLILNFLFYRRDEIDIYKKLRGAILKSGG